MKRKISLLTQKMTHPALTDVSLAVEGVSTYDLHPEKLPNLFKGTQLAVYGRYKGAGKAKISLSATAAGQPFGMAKEFEFPKADRSSPEIDRMWALRCVDDLMRNIRAEGESPGVVAKVVQIGEKYSIVSQYTSFLVLENEEQYHQRGIARHNAARIADEREAQEARRAETRTAWGNSSSSTSDTKPISSSGGRLFGGNCEYLFFGLLVALLAVRKKGRRQFRG